MGEPKTLDYWPRRRRGFVLSQRARQVLIVSAAVAMIAGLWHAGQLLWLGYQDAHDQMMSVGRGDVVWMIEFGYRRGELSYVVFCGGTEQVSGIVSRRTTSVAGSKRGRREAWLNRPDGEVVTLPARRQLFQYVEGEYQESDSRVTRAEFEAFMASNPRRYTIAELEAFVKPLRGEP
jgi:hypothetical protein